MNPNDLAIDLHRVEKIYKGKVYALRGIEMQVRRGEIFGLLGPNGAGKSTLVKIMMTVVKPTHAEGTLLGLPVGDKASLLRVGYLPENHRFPRYLTGRQTLEFFGGLSGLSRQSRRTRASELLETVGMTAWADRRVSTYSKGMMQRVGLAQALMGDPDLVVLDEPTDGVDPVGRREIRDVLALLRTRGTTVFVNSHLLSELELICDRVAILLGGTVARQGTIDELGAARQRYEIELHADFAGHGFADYVAKSLGLTFSPMPAFGSAGAFLRGQHATGLWIELERAVLRLGTTEPEQLKGPLDQLLAAGLMVRRVQVMRPTLEELFIEAVNDLNRGARQTPGAKLEPAARP